MLAKPRREDCEFEVSLGYVVRSCLKNKRMKLNEITVEERESRQEDTATQIRADGFISFETVGVEYTAIPHCVVLAQ